MCNKEIWWNNVFFDIPKPFILIELSFCETNEIKSKHFLKKFYRFTKDRFDAAIKWKTKQVKSLFPSILCSL